MIYAIVAILLLLTVLMCWQESRRRRIGFVPALLISVVTTPLFGYFIISSRPLREARGCTWCGNAQNEAEYCGGCGRNEAGEIKEIS